MTVAADKWEIVELIYRYSRAIDEDDLDLLDEVFVPGAVWELRHQDGLVVEGIEAIKEVLVRFHRMVDATQHLVGNPMIEIAGDVAHCRSEVRVMLWASERPSGERAHEAGSTYLDEFVRSPSGWRMTRRVIEVRWTNGTESLVG
jgi:ketosteroid isomerase-like protein